MGTAHTEPERDGLKVIHVALFRMGTLSLAEAYRILGYKVHHGTEDTLNMPWTQVSTRRCFLVLACLSRSGLDTAFTCPYRDIQPPRLLSRDAKYEMTDTIY